jgi:hypothetical protein
LRSCSPRSFNLGTLARLDTVSSATTARPSVSTSTAACPGGNRERPNDHDQAGAGFAGQGAPPPGGRISPQGDAAHDRGEVRVPALPRCAPRRHPAPLRSGAGRYGWRLRHEQEQQPVNARPRHRSSFRPFTGTPDAGRRWASGHHSPAEDVDLRPRRATICRRSTLTCRCRHGAAHHGRGPGDPSGTPRVDRARGDRAPLHAVLRTLASHPHPTRPNHESPAAPRHHAGPLEELG